MKRENRQFRVWDEKTKEWVSENRNLVIDSNGKLFEINKAGELIELNDNRYIVESKIGEYCHLSCKEICEGDIIMWSLLEQTYVDSIKYLEGSFSMTRDRKSKQVIRNDWSMGIYEIIGNIHENPELLK